MVTFELIKKILIIILVVNQSGTWEFSEAENITMTESVFNTTEIRLQPNSLIVK